jgi:hypothetical protein
MSGGWKRSMAEILWHRRETRRQTENTNLSLNNRATSRLYPLSEQKVCYESNWHPEEPCRRIRTKEYLANLLGPSDHGNNPHQGTTEAAPGDSPRKP